MNSGFKRTTITAALPYANGPLHIGHMAGCYIPADIYARFLRLKGEEVLFVCGSDEHGVAITIKAHKENRSPQAVVDQYHELMKDSFLDFGISFDHYSRTSSAIHHATASEFFLNIYQKGGELVAKETDQYFDIQAEQFLADRYIEGTCPVCSFAHAYGDQCENCGSTLSPSELLNPVSKLTGTKPELRKTTHWFLALDHHTEWLKEYILQTHKNDWKTNVLGQCRSWLEHGDGLKPRSMTRDMEWGVKVPSVVPNSEGKVLYVWFDAPIGYISATKEWALANGKNWETYWKDEDTRLIHFIGKDNIVFHCIVFPAILKSHGGFILPDNVPANEFLNLEGRKISTSRGWAVWLHEYLLDFPEMQDVLRYVLTANAPETKDNDFTWKEFQTRNNSELVSIFGNFVNRVLVLSEKYFNGQVFPEYKLLAAKEYDVAMLYESLNASLIILEDHLRKFRFRDALAEWMNLARAGNKYLTEMEPWKKYSKDSDNHEVAGVLCVCLEIAALLASYARPFMPSSAEKLHILLNADQWIEQLSMEVSPFSAGHKTLKPELLFRKIEDQEIDYQLEKLKSMNTENQNQEAPSAPIEEPIKEVSYDQFAALNLKVATILAAEQVPQTDKLIKITLDAGEAEPRIVVSGIAQSYTPEVIIGKQVMLLANLAPRKIKGIVSHGMLLLAEDKDGKLCFMTPERMVSNGSKIA